MLGCLLCFKEDLTVGTPVVEQDIFFWDQSTYP